MKLSEYEITINNLRTKIKSLENWDVLNQKYLETANQEIGKLKFYKENADILILKLLNEIEKLKQEKK